MELSDFLSNNRQQASLTNAQIQAQIKAALDAQSQTFAPQNPFTGAMSGTQSGTLQPYINRMTQHANNALYGGLLNYQPQSIMAGNAGGTPINSTPPQGFNLQGGLLNGANFGNRSWMNK